MPTRAASALLLLLCFSGSAWQRRAHALEFAPRDPAAAKFELRRAEAQPLSADCNDNGVEDAVDIAVGYSSDLDGNGVPDECESRR